jgi:elongation factor 1-beta
MGQIVATMKIFPEDVIIPTNDLKEAITSSMPEYASIHRIDDDPIAFGLVALIVHVLMPDSGGDEMTGVEDALRKVEGVSEVETLLVRRI